MEYQILRTIQDDFSLNRLSKLLMYRHHPLFVNFEGAKAPVMAFIIERVMGEWSLKFDINAKNVPAYGQDVEVTSPYKNIFFKTTVTALVSEEDFLGCRIQIPSEIHLLDLREDNRGNLVRAFETVTMGVFKNRPRNKGLRRYDLTVKEFSGKGAVVYIPLLTPERFEVNDTVLLELPEEIESIVHAMKGVIKNVSLIGKGHDDDYYRAWIEFSA